MAAPTAPVSSVAVNRRNFLKLSATGASIALVPASTLTLTACNTAWINTVMQDIPVIVNIVNSITSVVATATGNGALAATVAAEVAAGVKILQAGLRAFQDAATAYNANKSAGNLAKLVAALTAVQGDVQKVVATLPPGAQSTNVETVIIAALGTAILVLSSIQSLIPGAAPAAVTVAAAKSAAAGKVRPPSAATIASSYNAVLRLHGFASAVVAVP